MRGVGNVRAGTVMRIGFILMIAGLFTVLFGTVGPDLLESAYRQWTGQKEFYQNPLSRIALALAGAMVGVGIASLLLKGFGTGFEKWEKMDVGDRVTLFLGIFAGLIAS